MKIKFRYKAFFMLIFLLIGGLFTNIGNSECEKVKNGIEVQATIEDIIIQRSKTDEDSVDYTVLVSFTDPVYKTHEVQPLGFYSSSMHKGQSLTVFYDEATRSVIHKDSGLVFLVVGIVLLSVPCIYIGIKVLLWFILLGLVIYCKVKENKVRKGC